MNNNPQKKDSTPTVEVKIPTGRLYARPDGDDDYPGISVIYVDDAGKEEIVARVEFPVAPIPFYGNDENYNIPDCRINETVDEDGIPCETIKPGLFARVYQRVYMLDDDPISIAFDTDTGSELEETEGGAANG